MEAPAHYRRCHVCGYLNVAKTQPVAKCGDCGKSLAPFFYFDDRFTTVPGDGTLRPPRLQGEYNPIQGLTAYWETPK
jgi:hypothetical protein